MHEQKVMIVKPHNVQCWERPKGIVCHETSADIL